MTGLGDVLVTVLAVVVVWPLLFVVPGWLLVARVAPDLSPAGRAGLGIVASVFASAHLVNVVSLVMGGFDRGSVVVAVLLLAAVSVVLARVPLPWLAPPPSLDPRGIGPAIRASLPAFLVGLAGAAVVGFVLGFSIWHRTDAGWVAGGWNWSDLLVHVSIAKSLAAGNFPPEVPYFAGVPLTYHWFADFHAAIAMLVARVDVFTVFVLTNAVMAFALGVLVVELAEKITGSRRAALVAGLLVLFGGGMGWMRLPLDLARTGLGPLELIAAHAYDNSWDPGQPSFYIASILGTGFLPHRATALGLPGLVGAVLLAWVSLGRRPAGMATAGVLAALLAPFHLFAFPATYLVVLLMAVFRRAWRQRTALRDAILFVAPVVLAVPFVLGPALQQQGSGAVKVVPGWEMAPFENGPEAVAFFYLTNLGLPLVLAIGGALLPRLPNRGFLVAWAVALFLVPNLIQVSAVSFDMNKYFQVMWVALAILGGWALRSWPWAATALVLAACAVSPALVSAWHLSMGTVALSPAQERAARWIEANTPERSVFVTDAWINQPTDLAGRLRISTFGPYAANLGYDPAPREADIKRLRCGGADAAVEVMARYGATYVLSTGGGLDCADAQPTDLSADPRFEVVYDEGLTIWRLTAAPPGG
ncbi:MAG: hypothetical protein H6Q36_329 [Chloroflexi bacterium]|nr:hypothetical protein [Chloroflexota bacterium]